MSRQTNRLKNAQKSLLEFNEKLISEIPPSLNETRDVDAAVSLARLQHSADRLAGISKKLEALVCGTAFDGQHYDALESGKKSIPNRSLTRTKALGTKRQHTTEASCQKKRETATPTRRWVD